MKCSEMHQIATHFGEDPRHAGMTRGAARYPIPRDGLTEVCIGNEPSKGPALSLPKSLP